MLWAINVGCIQLDWELEVAVTVHQHDPLLAPEAPEAPEAQQWTASSGAHQDIPLAELYF